MAEGDDSSDGAKKPASQQVAGSEEIAATWPLTGLPVTGDEDAAKTYPVLVTKIDNTYASAPQLGLGKADMVVEELVEGGLTRLAAFFYSQLPTKVGPVRSMRASDIGIVSPVKRVGRHQWRGRSDDRPDQGRRASSSSRRARPASRATPAAARRTTSSPT